MITSFGISKTGLVRKVNEDCIFADHKPYFILADGMGGYEGGQIASTSAVEAARDYLASLPQEAYSEETAREAILIANRAILHRKISADDLQHMGTTMIIALISGTMLYWGHVGDSRLYLLKNGALTQVTTDHSFVMTLVEKGKITREEMRAHPRKNEITRAVGINSQLEVDTGHFSLDQDLIVLICSDGVSTMIDDAVIRDTILPLENGKIALDAAASGLIQKVYDAGASDNTSLILIHVDPVNEV